MHRAYQLVSSLLIKLIPIRSPSKMQNNTIIIKIILQQLLLLTVIITRIIAPQNLDRLLKQINQSVPFYVICGSRLLNCFLFLLIKSQILYAFYIGLIIFFEILCSTKFENIYLPLILFLLEILMVLVYALGQQVRINCKNMMGRLNLLPYIFRLLTTFIIALASFILTRQALFILIFMILAMKIALIEKQKKVNFFLRSALIRLEIFNLLVLMLALTKEYLNFSDLYFFGLTCFLIAFYIVQLPFINVSSKVVYEIGNKLPNQSGFQQCTPEQVIQYFQILTYWLISNNETQLVNFMFFHRKICKNAECPMWFKNDQDFDQDKYPLITLKKMVGLHIQRTLFALKKQNQQLNKFAVYFLSPSSRVYRFLKEDTFHGYRELYRLENDEKIKDDSNLAVIASYQQSNAKIEIKLKEIFKFKQLLYFLLLKKNIRSDYLVNISEITIKLNQQLLETSKNAQLVSYTNKFRLNKFFLQFMPQQINFQINTPQFILQNGSNEYISILLGAEGDRFGKVLNVNQQAVKWSYLPKDILLKVTINDLVPGQFRDKHVKAIATKYSKLTTFDSYHDFPQTIFFFNALGYIVPGKARIYRLTNSYGRYWNVIFEINYLLDAIMVMTFERKIIGFNEMGLSYGMKKEMIGKFISKPIAQFLLKSSASKRIKDFNEALLEEGDFIFNEDTTIQAVETMYRMCQYIIIKFTNKSEKFENTKRQRIEISYNKYNSFQYQKSGSLKMNNCFNPEQKQSPIIDKKSNQMEIVSNLLVDKRPNIHTEDIDQMILIKNKVDYKRNIKIHQDQLIQIPAKPIKMSNKRYEQISQQFYRANFHKRQQISSFQRMKYCIILAGFAFLLSILLILGSNSLDLFQSFQRQKEFEICLLFDKQFLSYTRLGVLPINTVHVPQIDIKRQIKSLSSQIEQRWKIIQDKEPNTNILLNIKVPENEFNTEYIGQLQDKQKQFLITLKQFQQNGGNQSIYIITKYLMLAIFPGYRKVVENVNIFFRDSETKWAITTILIRLLSFISLIIGAAISMMFYKLNYDRKMKVLNVISKIQNTTLINQIAKIEYLKKQAQSYQGLLPNSLNKFDQQDVLKIIDEGLQNASQPLMTEPLQKHLENIQLNQKQPKKIILERIINKLICFFVAIFTIAFIYTWKCLQCFEQIQNVEIFRQFYKYNNEIIAQTNTLWAGNNFIGKFDQEYLQDLQSDILKSNGNIEQLYVRGIERQVFGKDFTKFYTRLMHENICPLLSYSGCKTDFNGALESGVSQIYSFLNRKFEEINEAEKYYSTLRGVQILEKSEIDNTIKAASYYLPYALNQIEVNIRNSFKQNSNSHIIVFVLLTIVELLILLSMGICSWIVVNNIQKDSLILQGALNLLPFEAMIKIPHFQLFVSEVVQNIDN